ncbi:MAG: sterol desaturase family protein [Rhodobiaceae bacterium]|nr:sterol desaturase family protein [Rhodobiaceae bacterium]MBT7280558.1 sterol desaturase family protein [Rhodobiaceae bacterium]
MVASQALWIYWPWAVLVVVSAPFFEWVTHKYTLHRDLTDKPGFWRDYQIRLHHGHHLYPERRDLQFAPTSAIVIMFVQLYASYALMIYLVGHPHPAVWVPLLASLVYYLVYEWTHLAHHTQSYKPLTRWGGSLREAHMRHHFHNENYNWGITNGLGDVLLGTWKTTQDVQKSATAKKLSGFDGA